MQNHATWVVCANGWCAKIFRVVKFPKIEECEFLEHPESRLRNQDLVSSKSGRTFESMGMSRSAYEQRNEPHHLELEKFAKLLGEHLARARQAQSFSRLYLMASPAFLGLLRPHLDRLTQESLVAEIGKDMTEQSTAHIEAQLAND